MSEMWINMGPQHPMTHGLWNLRVKIDGEVILDCDPEMGYLHRGIEKISEDRHYNEVITLMDRCCYVAGLTWEHLYILAAEDALHIHPTERAEYIRTMCDEFQRIGSHLMWYSAFVQDIGLMTPFLYGMRDRDLVLDLFQSYTGARMTYRVHAGRGGPQRPSSRFHRPCSARARLVVGPVRRVRPALPRLRHLPKALRWTRRVEGHGLRRDGRHGPDAPLRGNEAGYPSGSALRRVQAA